MSKNLRIRITNSGEDAQGISRVGKESFYEAFNNIFDNKNELQEYLNHTYSIEKIEGSIQNPNNVYFIADVDNEIVGFCKIKKVANNSKLPYNKQSELQKIYVLPGFQGLKIGELLLKETFSFLQKLNVECIWLDVHVANTKAISFYHKHGFIKSGKHYFTIGRQTFEFDQMSSEIKY